MPFELPEESRAVPTQLQRPSPLSRIQTRHQALEWGDGWQRYAEEWEERVALLELFLAAERADRALTG